MALHLHTAVRWQEYKPAPGRRGVRYMRYVAQCPGCLRISHSAWSLVIVNKPARPTGRA